jgi:hypothetical protein
MQQHSQAPNAPNHELAFLLQDPRILAIDQVVEAVRDTTHQHENSKPNSEANDEYN